MRNLSTKNYGDSTAFGLDSCWHEYVKRENITFGINSCWCKNTRPQNTDTTNGIIKTKRKSAKRARTRGSGVRTKFVRLIIKIL